MRRRVCLLAWLLILIGCPLAQDRHEDRNTWTGRVVGVSDGDTVTVLHDRTPVKVRLQGVDAPEKAQPFGQRAKQFTSNMVFGKEVRVEVEAKDRYGRTVGRVCTVDSKQCLDEELVKAGLAWWYRQYAPKDRKLARLEAEARQAKRGLWADPNPTPPWAWRRGKGTANRGAGQRAPSRGTGPSTGAGPSTGTGPYHGNAKSKVLHAPGCRSYDCRSCTVGFKTIKEAEQAGYRSHATCVAAFARCYEACLQANQARAVGWEMIAAECQKECTKAKQPTL